MTLAILWPDIQQVYLNGLKTAMKMLSAIQTILAGTHFMYEGQEIGMYNYSPTRSIEDQDSINTHNKAKEQYDGNPVWINKINIALEKIARDKPQLPLQ